jgi:hypothetical protein
MIKNGRLGKVTNLFQNRVIWGDVSPILSPVGQGSNEDVAFLLSFDGVVRTFDRLLAQTRFRSFQLALQAGVRFRAAVESRERALLDDAGGLWL